MPLSTSAFFTYLDDVCGTQTIFSEIETMQLSDRDEGNVKPSVDCREMLTNVLEEVRREVQRSTGIEPEVQVEPPPSEISEPPNAAVFHRKGSTANVGRAIAGGRILTRPSAGSAI